MNDIFLKNVKLSGDVPITFGAIKDFVIFDVFAGVWHSSIGELEEAIVLDNAEEPLQSARDFHVSHLVPLKLIGKLASNGSGLKEIHIQNGAKSFLETSR